MLVKMLVGLSGPAYSLGPGDEKDFPQRQALNLIEAGFAVPVAGQVVETAVKARAPERRGRKGKSNVVSGNGNIGAGNGAGNGRRD